MKIRINARVPSCPTCAGALYKGIKDTDSYNGIYYFCKDCRVSFFIIGPGQSENELDCILEEENDS